MNFNEPHDHDPFSLEISQEKLGEVWHDLSEALVLHGEVLEPFANELPPENGPPPYRFSQKLPANFVQSTLRTNKDESAAEGFVEYAMGHRINPDDPQNEYEDNTEIYEVATVGWSSTLSNSRTTVDNSIVVRRITNTEGSEKYEAYTFTEYSEPNEEGAMKRVSYNALSPPSTADEITEEHTFVDLEDIGMAENTFGLEELNKMRQVIEYIKTDKSTS